MEKMGDEGGGDGRVTKKKLKIQTDVDAKKWEG